MGGTLIIFTSMAAFKTSSTSAHSSALHWAFTDPEMLFKISAFLFTVSIMLLVFLASCLYLNVYWSRQSRRILEEFEEGRRKKRKEVAAAVLYAILNAASKAKIDDEEEEEEPVGESECPKCPTQLTETDSGSVKVTPEEPEQVVKDGQEDKEAGLGSEVERVKLKDEDDSKKKKKMKKRLRKRRTDQNGGGEEEEKAAAAVEEESVLEFPFATASSGIQRKIKEQFDQLVKLHQSNCLTMTQIEKFTNFLLDVRNELLHRSDVIQRRFSITKALLKKADRSTRDRLNQQISRIELEQKRLVEDALVYNQVQQHLKHSPAYHKMLKVCACPETEAKTVKDVDSSDNDIGDISFEELLAQEKKDAIWQKFRISKG